MIIPGVNYTTLDWWRNQWKFKGFTSYSEYAKHDVGLFGNPNLATQPYIGLRVVNLVHAVVTLGTVGIIARIDTCNLWPRFWIDWSEPLLYPNCLHHFANTGPIWDDETAAMFALIS